MVGCTENGSKTENTYVVEGLPEKIDVYQGQKFNYSTLDIVLKNDVGERLDATIVYSIEDTTTLDENEHQLTVSFYINDELVKEVNTILNIVVEDFSYYTFVESSGTITDYDESHGTDIYIPAKINGKSVVSIAPGAFENKGITSVIFSEGLELIGMYAFQENNISEVVFVDSLREIARAAFYNNNVTSVTLYGDVSLGFGVFEENSVEQVTFLSENMVPINDWKAIGFSGVAYPDVVVHNGLYIAEGTIIDYDETYSKDVVIPASVGDMAITTIASYAFYQKGIESVTFSEGIETILYGAFSENSLEEVQLPDSIEEIQGQAFALNSVHTVSLFGDTTLYPDAFGGNTITVVNVTGEPNFLLKRDWVIIGFGRVPVPE